MNEVGAEFRILYVTHEIPYPQRAGHHLRYGELADLLSEVGQVEMLGFSEGGDFSERQGAVFVQGVRGDVRIRRKPIALARALASSVRTGRPYSLTKYRGDAMRSAIERCIARWKPDVIISSLFTCQFVPRGSWIRLLDVHNMEGDLWAEFGKAGSAPKRAFVQREARKLSAYETQAYRENDGIVAISPEDAERISRRAETPIRHVPVAIQPAYVPIRADAYDVGMIGVWSWGPNAEALGFFERQVVPGLQARGLRICIFGPGMSAGARRRLSRHGVWCAGFVPDVRTFYENVRVVAAPFFVGGGVRMKVAEALSHGRPVVGFPLAFRGIGPGVPPDWIVSDAAAMVERSARLAARPEAPSAGLFRAHDRATRSEALADLLRAAGVERAFGREGQSSGPIS